MFLNNQQVTKEIKREIKKFLEKQIIMTQNSKPMGCNKSSPKREFYSNTILPQETIKTLNRQPHFTPKTTGKRTPHPKFSRRKEIINIWAEINERKNSKD